jgi:hypothetical protein
MQVKERLTSFSVPLTLELLPFGGAQAEGRREGMTGTLAGLSIFAALLAAVALIAGSLNETWLHGFGL